MECRLMEWVESRLSHKSLAESEYAPEIRRLLADEGIRVRPRLLLFAYRISSSVYRLSYLVPNNRKHC
ncbi:hypothetical protein SAMN05444342_3774 [Haladaptatus paucihalophilus DX253]|uniref:Uncharacterized protein n=1 Tax=Haladaptatus paucihalophilus DX253 TaxID=797209 RepID=A0A1M7AA76_HALPU|nr:hypothetical protein SAMN05444342_3774 [Haladaptatus paucihalophilus DX253]